MQTVRQVPDPPGPFRGYDPIVVDGLIRRLDTPPSTGCSHCSLRTSALDIGSRWPFEAWAASCPRLRRKSRRRTHGDLPLRAKGMNSMCALCHAAEKCQSIFGMPDVRGILSIGFWCFAVL
jgi:hypothetical protein